jgi:hypothetical protein
MGTTDATERVKRELHRAVDNVRAEIDRIEILAAALAAFSQPVPSYDPYFHHMRSLSAHMMGRDQ